jgi:RNA polymerase sigma-70 factor, ECF subfamily
MTVSEDFTSAAAQFRGELLIHCYRMVGSVTDAEDLVQETYLRAWRSYEGFEGRSSVRTWLYRIATNVCLTAIERRGRRPLPSGLGAPAGDPQVPLAAGPEVPWLQPIPDALLAGQDDDPAAAAASRAGIRLAFVAALQHLSGRQRAVLILRDVLDLPAAQAADLLGTTAAAVNSGLRRARAELAEARPAEDEITEPADPGRRALLDRFAAAFENADVAALAGLLREDVTLEMPPLLTWFAGREAVTGFLASRAFTEPGRFLLVPVMGQRAARLRGLRARRRWVLPGVRRDGTRGHRDGDRADRHVLRYGPVRVVRPASRARRRGRSRSQARPGLNASRLESPAAANSGSPAGPYQQDASWAARNPGGPSCPDMK